MSDSNQETWADQIITLLGTIDDNVGGSSSAAYVHLQEQQTDGTNGGNFATGAWRTRAINTEVSDPSDICTLSSNQFTLPAGTYEIDGFAHAWSVGQNRLRLYNVSDTEVVMVGDSGWAPSSHVSTRSNIRGRFTLASETTLELQHACSLTNANGFGSAASLSTGNEIYADIVIRKVA